LWCWTYWITSVDAINPDFTVLTQNLVNKIQEKDCQINTWTVNDLKNIELMKTFGLDGIISDFPDRL